MTEQINEAFVPQKATAPNWGRRNAYKPPVHFRDHEFSQLPRPIAMSGPGNHNQYTKYMLENGRTR